MDVRYDTGGRYVCRVAGSGRCVGVLMRMVMYRVDDRGLCVGLSVRRASVWL